MWVVATEIQVGDVSYIGHIRKNKVYTTIDEAKKERDKVNARGANFKLFKVMLQEVDGKDG